MLYPPKSDTNLSALPPLIIHLLRLLARFQYEPAHHLTLSALFGPLYCVRLFRPQ